MVLNEAREGGFDIAVAASILDHQLDAVRARRSLDVSGLRLRGGIAGIDEDADNFGARDQLA